MVNVFYVMKDLVMLQQMVKLSTELVLNIMVHRHQRSTIVKVITIKDNVWIASQVTI